MLSTSEQCSLFEAELEYEFDVASEELSASEREVALVPEFELEDEL